MAFPSSPSHGDTHNGYFYDSTTLSWRTSGTYLDVSLDDFYIKSENASDYYDIAPESARVLDIEGGSLYLGEVPPKSKDVTIIPGGFGDTGDTHVHQAFFSVWPEGANRITNGNCESTTKPAWDSDTGSTVGCTFVRDAAQKYAGTYSYKMTKSTTGYDIWKFHDSDTSYQSLAPGDVVHCEVMGYFPSGQTGVPTPTNALLAIRTIFGATPKYLSNCLTEFNVWQKLVINFTIPYHTEFDGWRFYIQMALDAVGTYAYFDECKAWIIKNDKPAIHPTMALRNYVTTTNLMDTTNWVYSASYQSNPRMEYDAGIGKEVYTWNRGTTLTVSYIYKNTGYSLPAGTWSSSFWYKCNYETKLSSYMYGPATKGAYYLAPANKWAHMTLPVTTASTGTGFQICEIALTAGGNFPVDIEFKMADPAFSARQFTTIFKENTALIGYDSLSHEISLGSIGTFMAWVKPGCRVSQAHNISIFTDYSNTVDHTMNLYYSNSTHTFRWRKKGSTQVDLDASAAFVYDSMLQQWQHIAISWNDTTREYYMYLNGALAASDTSTMTIPYGPTSIVSIGTFSGYLSPAEYQWNGSIADVLLDSTEWDAADIRAHYISGKPWRYEPGSKTFNKPVAWYKFNNTDNKKTITDHSGNGYDATKVNFGPIARYQFEDNAIDSEGDFGEVVRYTMDDNVEDTKGKYDGTANNITYVTSDTGMGKAASFNGSTSDIQILANGSGVFSLQEYSISAWVKVTALIDYIIIWSYDYTAHSAPYYAQHIRINVGGDILFAWADSGVSEHINTPGGTIGTTNWHHIVCTYKSGEQKIYVDDVEKGSGTLVGTATYYGNEVWIGRANFAYTKAVLIDEVRFFNEALSPAQVSELHGNPAGHNGIETNITYSTGKSEKAAVFNGTTSYVTLPSETYLTLQSPWSLSVWVNTDTLNPAEAHIRIIYFANGSATLAIIWDDANNRWYSRTTDAAGANAKYIFGGPTGTIYAGEWHHIALTNDGNGVIEFYEDGFSTDTGSVAGMSDWTASVGYVGGVATSENFDGLMDEVRFYDYALSASEVKALFDRPSGLAEIVDGTLESAMSFNGVDQYATVLPGEGPSFAGKEAISISFWMKTPDITQDIRPIQVGSYQCLFYSNGANGIWKWYVHTDIVALSLNFETALTPDTWYHLVGTYDGEHMRVYLDGKEDATPKTQAGGIISSDDGKVTIGALSAASFNTIVSIDDVRIFDYTLSIKEIQDLYRQFAPQSLIFPGIRLENRETITQNFNNRNKGGVQWRFQ